MEQMMSGLIFSPNWRDTVSINNATSATSAVMLVDESTQLLLTNTSASATASVLVTWFYSASDTMTGDVPTMTNGLLLLPLTQIRIAVPFGHKVIRTIASAADGAVVVTPGRGA